jgi:DNA-directed RNA polymerase specialized sigma24 family protein
VSVVRGVAIATEPVTLTSVYRDRYAPMVRLARQVVGSVAIAEELTQDAFVRLQGAWDRVDNPAAFLNTTLINLCRTWMKRASTGDRLAAFAADSPVGLPLELDETWQALSRLPDKYRIVLALRFYADLPEAEIATLLDCRLGTVKSQIHRGLAKLKEVLS